MSKTNIAMAVINPTSVNFFPEDQMPDREDTPMHQIINAIVGGHFDYVRPVRGNDFVGYVHDEGLLLGLEPNALASAVFGQFLCGPCVVVGTLNEYGVVDGADYNLEGKDVQFLSRLADAAYIWRDSQVEVEETLA